MSESWDDFLGDLKGHFLQGLPDFLAQNMKELKDLDTSLGLRLRSYMKEMKEPQKDAKNCGLHFFSDYIGDFISQIAPFEIEAYEKKLTIPLEKQNELFHLIEKVHSDIRSYAEVLSTNEDKFEYWDARNNSFIYIATLFSSLNWSSDALNDHVDHQSLEVETQSEKDSLFQMIDPQEKHDKEQSWIEDLYLICARGDHDLALAIESVVEVIQKRKIIPLPELRNDIMGLFSLRGEVIPVVCLDGFTEQDDDKLVVVCKREKSKFAFLSSRADQVVKISRNEMQDPVQLTAYPQSNVIESYVLRENKILFICNLKAMVAA